MSLLGLDVILITLEFIFKEAYESSLKIKFLAKVLPGLAHIAVWISVMVFIFNKDFDCKESIFPLYKNENRLASIMGNFISICDSYGSAIVAKHCLLDYSLKILRK